MERITKLQLQTSVNCYNPWILTIQEDTLILTNYKEQHMTHTY